MNDHENNDEEKRVHTNLPISTSEWRDDFLQVKIVLLNVEFINEVL